MSAPTSSAAIELPFSSIDDEIRKVLEYEGVRFKPRVFGPIMELDDLADDSLELDKQSGYLWIEVEDGIFRLQKEAENGEFYELENLLVKKQIPFDRDTSPDYAISAELRIFRPGNPPTDLRIPQDEDLCGLIQNIRDKLKEITDIRVLQEIQGIIDCLEEVDPPYPLLMDLVKEGAYAAQ